MSFAAAAVPESSFSITHLAIGDAAAACLNRLFALQEHKSRREHTHMWERFIHKGPEPKHSMVRFLATLWTVAQTDAECQKGSFQAV